MLPSGTEQILNKRVLPVADWFAENAYIAPGLHRFMTALGLMSGLMAGRYVMDILVGTDRNGEITDKNKLPPPLQPYHGIFYYNKFDDSPHAKWQKVIDHCAPAIVGAAGAMIGSAYFFRALHPAAKKLTQELASGKSELYMQQADYMANMVQSKYYNRLAGLNFTLGSTTGMHLFPNPFNTMGSAIRFQLGAGKKPMFPGLFGLTGNRGTQSMNLYHSLQDMMSWAENNIAHYGGTEWYKENNALFKKARNALQNFKDITPEQAAEFEQYILSNVQKLEQTAQRVSREYGNSAGNALLAELKKDEEFTSTLQQAFWSNGLENKFIEMGLLDPHHPEKSKVLFGDNGIISGFAKILGDGKEVERVEQQWRDAFQARHETGKAEIKRYHQGIPLFMDHVVLASIGVVAASLATLGVIGSATAHAKPKPHDMNEIRPANVPRHEAARLAHLNQEAPTGINAKPLDALNWLSNVLVVPPSLHRFMNAASLSTFLYGGMQLSNSLAGRGLRGEILSKEQVWFPMLHNTMEYVWKSGHTADRWKYVAHQLLPVAVGACGTYTGSRLFFKDRITQAKQAEYLEDYTDKISLDESEIYARGAGVTSILNTGSGVHLLPLISYSSNLQNRFLMAQGQQVATPGLGGVWSGNPSTYPFHIKKLLDMTIQYAVHNPGEFPQEFDKMAHAVIAKLYPTLPADEMKAKEDAFVDELYAVRDKYWRRGGIPIEDKEACKKELTEHFRKEGFEKTLVKIGLDPLKANLDHNGMSGWIAKSLGASSDIKQDIKAYREKAAQRLAALAPENHIHAPAQSMQLATAPHQER